MVRQWGYTHLWLFSWRIVAVERNPGEGPKMAKRVLLGLMLTVAVAGYAWGAPTAEQKAELKALADVMAKAATLFKEKKFEDCGTAIREAQEKMESLSASGDKAILRQLETHHKRVKSAHALLELEGIELPPLMPLVADEPEPKKPKNEPSPAGNSPSFVKHVAPVLIARCGNCHVNQAKGEFSAASYAALMKGAGAAGKVVFPGDAMGSRMIEVIVSGDMPRGGQKLTPAEFAVLTTWINNGAKFDGTDENASIAGPGSAPDSTKPAEPVIAQATGKETVSFSKEIAPVLAQNCNGCHGTNRPRENFSLATFTSLMKGGDGGPAITPGKKDSLLVMKLKGMGGGQRMPAGGLPPLPDPIIAKIETWIAEGAKFDGPDAMAPLARIAALAKAAGASHEELSADRMKMAEATWNTAMPGIKFDTAETGNFFAMGTVGENTLKDIVERAERTIPKVAQMLGAPTEKPLLKGRFTLFVVKVRYDFGEIGMVLAGSSTPPKGFGDWQYDGVDAAGVVLAPKDDKDYDIESLIAQQIASAYVASSGKNVPKWFAEGMGRVVASRLAPKDPRVQEWDSTVPAVFASLSAKPDAFMTPKFEPEAANLAAYSYARFLLNDARRFEQLTAGLRSGGKFDDVFAAAYGGTPNAVTAAWFRKGPGRTRTSR
jgi:mono/diheme cytochrome c family protein